MANQISKKKLTKYLLDTVAIAFWIYILVKSFVFDIDSYLLGFIAPTLTWTLNLRLFVLLLSIAILWVVLGNKRFLLSFAYVVGYPLVIMFWKLPLFILRRWATFIILLPSIFDTLVSFRTTFILYTAILISASAVVLSRQPIILIPAMAGLALSLIFILYRAFARTHSTRIYSRLAAYVRTLHPKITGGEFDVAPVVTPTSAPAQARPEQPSPPQEAFPQLYMSYVIFDYVSQRVDQVERERNYNLILVSSLLNVMFWAVILFAFVHWAVYKLDPLAYSGTGAGSFLQFLAFSLGHLANSDLIAIRPVSSLAIAATSLQVVCSLLILVIGVFSIFTAQRDSFREDFQEFLGAVHKTVELVNERIAFKYSMSSSQLEMRIAVKGRNGVNLLRRLRGLPELESPATDSGTTQSPRN